MKKINPFLILLSVVCFSYNKLTFSQVSKFGFQKVLREQPETKTPFAVTNEGQKTLEVLAANHIIPISLTKDWIYITTTPQKIQELMNQKLIADFYFEVSKGQLLNDSTRLKHSINQVHTGINGLPIPLTGKNVIIGVVDGGIDFYHPDLLDENGKTRVLYFWDHNLSPDATHEYLQPYNYGIEFDSSEINAHSYSFAVNGTNIAHGTNMTGISAGNGLANGKNKGMAPDSKIIFVRTNIFIPNWTLSIAHACDYIFKKADALGMPCVINLSLGTTMGSHDGNDPATQQIEALLDQKPGRIVVCSAGNSGDKENYHVRGIVDSDTSFTWLENSPSNTVYFDLWANTSEIQNVNYSFGANLPNGSFSNRGNTIFRNAMAFTSGVPILDTIRNSNGDRIATLEIYIGQANGRYNMQVLSYVDSTSYLYRFSTTGSGKYDLWSGLGNGYNRNVSNIPTSITFPPIVHYHAPDSLQSIVSSWACSEKVVTVGNINNRASYIDFNGNLRSLAAGVYSDRLSPTSSKGPTRLDLIKPDISATGDFSFAPTTLSFGDPAKIIQGGWHSRAGGTSAASAVIAGIAALYLERCNNATYNDFLTDLKNNAFTDAYTGIVPNNAFGYGKANALATILSKNYVSNIEGNSIFCSGTDQLTVSSASDIDSVVWLFNGTYTNQNPLTVSQEGTYVSFSYNDKSCIDTDTITITQGQIPDAPTISIISGVLTATTSPNYQWHLNGNPLMGQNLQTLLGTINPTGQYICTTTSPDGCIASSNIYQQNASIIEINNKVAIFPNPAENSFEIIGMENLQKLIIEDMNGKKVKEIKLNSSKVDISDLRRGIYFIKIYSEKEILSTKLERL